MLTWLGTRSIAVRLFLSAAFWSVLILLLAGVTLSAINRRSAEVDFDERLSVYARALAANVANPGEDVKSNIGQLGEPMFELPLSGWYWQITPQDGDPDDIKASRSLFAERLPNLEQNGVPVGLGGSRKGYAIGPRRPAAARGRTRDRDRRQASLSGSGRGFARGGRTRHPQLQSRAGPHAVASRPGPDPVHRVAGQVRPDAAAPPRRRRRRDPAWRRRKDRRAVPTRHRAAGQRTQPAHRRQTARSSTAREPMSATWLTR